MRASVEGWLGSPVVRADTQPGGFSPGVAARLLSANGRRVFLKAVAPTGNPDAPAFHRREARVVAALPAGAPVPRLLWTHDEDEAGWVVLAFEDIAGRPPAQPWRADELTRVVGAMVDLARLLTPSPIPAAEVGRASTDGLFGQRWWPRLRDEPPPGLDPWSARHAAALAEVEIGAAGAVAGETLLHLDTRADNVLLTPERVYIVDWPHARLGAAWLDIVCMAPSVTMQGGPEPEALLRQHPAATAADPAAVTAAVAALAGFLTHGALQPPPPGLPTLRAFQAAQGQVARAWLARRLGLV